MSPDPEARCNRCSGNHTRRRQRRSTRERERGRPDVESDVAMAAGTCQPTRRPTRVVAAARAKGRVRQGRPAASATSRTVRRSPLSTSTQLHLVPLSAPSIPTLGKGGRIFIRKISIILVSAQLHHQAYQFTPATVAVMPVYLGFRVGEAGFEPRPPAPKAARSCCPTAANHQLPRHVCKPMYPHMYPGCTPNYTPLHPVLAGRSKTS